MDLQSWPNCTIPGCTAKVCTWGSHDKCYPHEEKIVGKNEMNNRYNMGLLMSYSGDLEVEVLPDPVVTRRYEDMMSGVAALDLNDPEITIERDFGQDSSTWFFEHPLHGRQSGFDSALDAYEALQRACKAEKKT